MGTLQKRRNVYVHMRYDTVEFGTGCQRLSVGGHCWNRLSLVDGPGGCQRLSVGGHCWNRLSLVDGPGGGGDYL